MDFNKTVRRQTPRYYTIETFRFKYAGATDDHHIELAFSKKGADQRKEWLTSHMEEVKRRKEIGLPERYLYTKEIKMVTFSDFVNLELVLFSNGDNVRYLSELLFHN